MSTMDRILFNYLYKAGCLCFSNKCSLHIKFFKLMQSYCGFLNSIIYFLLFSLCMLFIRIGRLALKLWKISKNWLNSHIFRFSVKSLSTKMIILVQLTLMIKHKLKKSILQVLWITNKLDQQRVHQIKIKWFKKKVSQEFNL